MTAEFCVTYVSNSEMHACQNFDMKTVMKIRHSFSPAFNSKPA